MTPEIDRGIVELRNQVRARQRELWRERRRRQWRALLWSVLAVATLAVAWMLVRLLLWTRLP